MDSRQKGGATVIPDMDQHPNFSFIPVTGRVKKKQVLKRFLVHPVQTKDVDIRAQLRNWGAVLIDQKQQHSSMPTRKAQAIYKGASRKNLVVGSPDYRQTLELAVETLYFKKPSTICWCDDCPLIISIQGIMKTLKESFPQTPELVIETTEDGLRKDMLKWRRDERVFTQRRRCRWFKCRILFYPNTSKAFPYCGLPHRKAARARGWYWYVTKKGSIVKRFKKEEPCQTCHNSFWGSKTAVNCESCVTKKLKKRKKVRAKKRTRTVKGRKRKRCARKKCDKLFLPKTQRGRRQKYCSDACRRAENRGK